MKKIYLIVTAAIILFSANISAQLPAFGWANNSGNMPLLADDAGYATSIDPSGNIYVAGINTGIADFDGSLNIAMLSAPTGTINDVFFAKYNSTGACVWAKTIGDPVNIEKIVCINSDPSGNVYIVGAFWGTTDFDPSPAVFNLTASAAGDGFIAKYDASGNFITAFSIGSTGADIVNSIATDASGNIFVIGTFCGIVDFDPSPAVVNLTAAGGVGGNSDIFIAKYTPAGSYAWAFKLGNTTVDYGNAIAVDPAGNVYAVGGVGGSCDFDPGPGVVTFSAGAYIAKYDNNGNYNFAVNSGAMGTSIALDASLNICLTGYFWGTWDFDPGPGIANLTSTPGGNEDIFISKYNNVGNYIYAKSMGGTLSDRGMSIAVDVASNVYITGYFLGTADFDPSPATATLASAGSWDIYVAKYNNLGNYVFANRFGSTGPDQGSGIAVDASSNAIVTGQFSLTVDFDPSVAVVNRQSYYANSFYYAKYNTSGNYVWAYSSADGGIGGNNGAGITTDPSGNVYSVGGFSSSVDFDPGPGEYSMTGLNTFVRKLDNAGNFVWAIKIDPNLNLINIQLDGSGNIYLSGELFSTADCDPGPGVYTLAATPGAPLSVVLKLDPLGNFIWAKAVGGNTGGSLVNMHKLDASGNVYLTGYFNGTGDFDPGPGVFNLISGGSQDGYICKLDASGNFVWAKSFGAVSADNSTCLALDASSNVYTTGKFATTVDFDPGPGVFNLASAGYFDIFILKLDANGNFVWAKRMGASIADEYGASIATDGSGNVLTTGQYSTTVDFDPGPGVFNLSPVAVTDIYISKLDNAGNFVWAKSIGGNGGELPYGIFIDVSDNVYTTGIFTGNADFDPSPGTYSLTALGLHDAFISKLNSAGNFAWARKLGGPGTGTEYIYSACIDAAGSIFGTGSFGDTFFNNTNFEDFDPTPINYNLFSGQINDFFVFKWTQCITLPATGAITGNTMVCVGSLNNYSVAPVVGATSYTWSLPGGWIGTSSTNTISVTAGPGTATIVAYASNTCGSAPPSTIVVTSNPAPSLPGPINGSVTVCQGTLKTYSIASVVGATSYSWTLPGGWTGTSTTNIITTTVGPSSGNINVFAVNACGIAGPQSLSITVNTVPPAPGPIAGYTLVCAGNLNLYTISPVPNTVNYQWTLPVGWTGSSISTSINATAGITSGTVYVTAFNICGGSPSSGLYVSVGTSPSLPGAISGNTSVCAGSSNIYSVAPVVGASAYSWGLPPGWTGSSSTNSINATASGAGGIVSVAATNTCGSSPVRTLNVVVVTNSVSPGPISGSINVCQSTSLTYSVALVGGATSYSWVLPGGWSGTSTTNIITTTVGPSSGNILVYAINACGVSPVQSLSVTVSPTPPTPGAINGNITVCSGSSNTYTIAPVGGATSYTWTLPGGWTGSSPNNTINTTASATSGNVSVTANNACGASSPQTLSVTVNPPPSTPGAISGNILICSGTSNTYSVAAVVGATSYSWTKPGGWTGVSITNIINTTASATSGFVIVLASNACGNSSAQTLSVTVNTIPSTPGAISGSVNLCAGGSAVYGVAPVVGATSYTWSLPPGWTGSSNTNTINATSGSTGVFSVTASNACGTSAMQTLNVTVNPTPTVTINGGAAPICVGSVVTLTANGAATYSWSTGPVTSTIAPSPTITTTYSVIGTSAGCTGNAAITITVNPLPIVTANPNNTIVCSGNTVALTGGGANTYTWSGGIIDGVAFSPTVNASYTVTGTSLAGCNNTAVANITVSAIPNTPVSISGPTALCAGAPVAIYSINPVAGATGYVWSLPAGWGGVSSSTSISVTPALNSGIVSVFASNTCGSSSAQTLSVTINPVPTVTAIGNPLSVCPAANVTLSAGGANTYSWSNGALTASTVINPLVTTIYSVTGTDGLGCTNFTTITIGVFANPTVTAVSNTSLLCIGQSATLTANGASTYTWNPGGAAASIVISPTVNTTYTLTGTNGNACTNSFVFTQSVAVCAGLSALTSAKAEVSVYPNPTSGIVILEKEAMLNGRQASVLGRIEIFNYIGSLIYYSETKESKTEIDLSAYANGIYFIRIDTVTKKIIKE